MLGGNAQGELGDEGDEEIWIAWAKKTHQKNQHQYKMFEEEEERASKEELEIIKKGVEERRKIAHETNKQLRDESKAEYHRMREIEFARYETNGENLATITVWEARMTLFNGAWATTTTEIDNEYFMELKTVEANWMDERRRTKAAAFQQALQREWRWDEKERALTALALKRKSKKEEVRRQAEKESSARVQEREVQIERIEEGEDVGEMEIVDEGEGELHTERVQEEELQMERVEEVGLEEQRESEGVIDGEGQMESAQEGGVQMERVEGGGEAGGAGRI